MLSKTITFDEIRAKSKKNTEVVTKHGEMVVATETYYKENFEEIDFDSEEELIIRKF